MARARLATSIVLVFIVKGFFAVGTWLGVGGIVRSFIVEAAGEVEVGA